MLQWLKFNFHYMSNGTWDSVFVRMVGKVHVFLFAYSKTLLFRIAVRGMCTFRYSLLWILCLLDHAALWYVENKRPTWCHLLFYFTSYVLNMFRTLMYPSSGACDCSVELPHWSYCSWFDVCWSFGVVGLEWYPCAGWSSLQGGYHCCETSCHINYGEFLY